MQNILLKIRIWLIVGFLAGGAIFLSHCSSQQQKDEATADTYVNLSDTVDYVGMDKCISCHGNVHETYIETGMGQSFGLATKDKSAAEFGNHVAVYDTVNDLYYHPFWEKDTLKIREYRLDGTDTIHQRTEAISYVIGSGQHTNSHLLDVDGYVYQAPITYYTQKEIWDMAPGFRGNNTRFSRIISMECMTCHNAMPDHVEGSVNKYEKVPTGINCERCHGPGEVHVQRKMAGEVIDTAKFIDYTIVNPGDLSADLQMSLCQRCHLQGVAVLNPGKEWEDFRPGMHLDSVMQVYLPKFRGEGDPFLMASQAERLRKSNCYKMAELSCITCHNPHISVDETGRETFNQTCKSCHTAGTEPDCGLELDTRMTKNNNDCSNCHMPKSGSVDIPHVAITDHYIRIPDDEEIVREVSPQDKDVVFAGLQNMTTKNPTPLMMARGFLRLYEGFSSKPAYLDSIRSKLEMAGTIDEPVLFNAWVHYYYLMEDYESIRSLSTNEIQQLVQDPNTLYRMGEAFMAVKNYTQAQVFVKRAVDEQPLNLEFRNRLGSIYLYQRNIELAEREFEFVIKEQPKMVPALSNLGTVYINTGRGKKGAELLQKAISLNPDYELAYFNLAQYYVSRYEEGKAREVLESLLRNQPWNERARATLRGF